MSDAAADTGEGGARTPERPGSGLLEQVGRGVVYWFLLGFSVDPAVRSMLDRTALALPFGAGALVTVGVAAVLTHRPDPPSYRRVTAFSLGSAGLWWVLDAAVGPTAPTRGSLYPLVDAALAWVAAFLFGYALAFGTDWSAVTDRLLVRERRDRP